MNRLATTLALFLLVLPAFVLAADPLVITCPPDLDIECGESSDPSRTGEPTTESTCLAPWINEIHYDNTGADFEEFIEVAGPEGLDLTGYEISLYSGGNERVYDTMSLAGTIDDESF